MIRTIVPIGLMAVFFCLSLSGSAEATTMSYQGKLVAADDTTGGTQQRSMTFGIYTSSSGGTTHRGGEAIWEETHPSVDIGSDGTFQVQLGSIVELDTSDADHDSLWLEIEVDGEILQPRIPVSAVPWAFRSFDSGSGGGANGWVDDGSVVRLETSIDNVGIGTANPSEKLEVDGNIHASGTVSSGNSIIIDGTADEIRSSSGVISFDDDTLKVSGSMFAGGAGWPAVFPNQTAINVREVFHADPEVWSYGIHTYTYKNHGTVCGIRGVGQALGGASAIGVDGTAEYGLANYGVSGFAIGDANTSSGSSYGVIGTSQDDLFSYGLYGRATQSAVGYGVYGYATANGTNWAGYFSGDVNVTGTLSKGAGSFKIDHPLDPENKYLSHSFVESPDMMNVYNGNITTDENGDAVVPLPEYFSALNKDFRYQLTVIGQFAQAIVSEEISGNQFSILTDKPNVKVSWQVTGVRKDAFAEANRIQVEVSKPDKERGRYLHPRAFGLGEELDINYEQHQQAMQGMIGEDQRDATGRSR